MPTKLACVALLLASALAGCGKDRYKDPSTARSEIEPRGHSVPTRVAVSPAAEEWEEEFEIESQKMTPASGTMTPAAGTAPRSEGAEAGAEVAETSRGPVILQYEAVNELAHAVCLHQSRCGESVRQDCERTVKDQSAAALAGCDHGLSRTEFSVCLTAIAAKACGENPTTLRECRASSLCLP